jgi:hypothetical protein
MTEHLQIHLRQHHLSIATTIQTIHHALPAKLNPSHSLCSASMLQRGTSERADSIWK